MSGLKNFNNTCFIDSIIQALFHLPPFIDFITQIDIQCPIIDKTKALFGLISHQNTNRHEIDKATIALLDECKKSEFLIKLEFSGKGFRNQQDCCEFLESFLDYINNKIFEFINPFGNYVSNDHVNTRKTLLHKLYNLNIVEKRNCSKNHVFEQARDETIIHLCLPTDTNSCDFSELFSTYFEKEIIKDAICTESHNNKECKNSLTKRLRLNQPAEILIVQLKRFYNAFNVSQKNNVNVSLQFDISSEFLSGCEYELFSIVCHTGGESINFGHYTAFCKEKDKNWYLFDDMRGVSFADLTSNDSDDYKTCLSKSYILFYKRKNVLLLSLEDQLTQLTVSQPSPRKQDLSIDSEKTDYKNKKVHFFPLNVYEYLHN